MTRLLIPAFTEEGLLYHRSPTDRRSTFGDITDAIAQSCQNTHHDAVALGARRFEKPAPDARAAPPEAHESLISRKTVAEVPLTGLSFASNAADVLPREISRA
jgi:hypothetical protein